MIVEQKLGAALLDQAAERIVHLLDQQDEVDRIPGHRVALRLDARQRHEVVDQVAHPRRLVEHHLQEAGRGSSGRRRHPLPAAFRGSRAGWRAGCAARGWHLATKSTRI
jgi:hypothetical protein